MQQLRRLNARRQCPEAPRSFEDYLFFDLLWSDPHPDDGDGVHESSRFDPDGSGRMDVADFRASLETMNATLAHPHEPLTAQQIALLSDSLPQTADAEIDYLAFMNAFEVVDTTHFEGEGRLEA